MRKKRFYNSVTGSLGLCFPSRFSRPLPFDFDRTSLTRLGLAFLWAIYFIKLQFSPNCAIKVTLYQATLILICQCEELIGFDNTRLTLKPFKGGARELETIKVQSFFVATSFFNLSITWKVLIRVGDNLHDNFPTSLRVAIILTGSTC